MVNCPTGWSAGRPLLILRFPLSARNSSRYHICAFLALAYSRAQMNSQWEIDKLFALYCDIAPTSVTNDVQAPSLSQNALEEDPVKQHPLPVRVLECAFASTRVHTSAHRRGPLCVDHLCRYSVRYPPKCSDPNAGGGGALGVDHCRGSAYPLAGSDTEQWRRWRCWREAAAGQGCAPS